MAPRSSFLPTHTAPEVLASILRKIAAAKAARRQPVVLFDLDGTLFDNGPRTWQILYEYALQKRRDPLSKKLPQLQKMGLPYMLKDILALVDEHDPVQLQEAAAFWKDRFFRDDYVRYDEPLRGAHQFCITLWEAGATVVYFSGRDSPNMLIGTAFSLRTHCFPVAVPRAVITLKEAFEVEDLVFKREAMDFMDSMGDVVASFDNEPANCNMFHERWPEAETVALATSHAPNPKPLHSTVKAIADFVE